MLTNFIGEQKSTSHEHLRKYTSKQTNVLMKMHKMKKKYYKMIIK